MKSVTELETAIMPPWSLLLVLALINTSACSHFLYPEQDRQIPAASLLDNNNLLIGVLPQGVAFAVDLITGTLYLPPDGRGALERHRDRLLAVSPGAGPDSSDRADIARHLSSWLKEPVNGEGLRFYRLKPRPEPGRLLL